MPKKSSILKAEKQRREELLERARYRKWIFGFIQISLGLWLALMLMQAASFHFRIWPLEAAASYAPQIMMFGWLSVFLYAIAATWYGIVRSWTWFVRKLGPLGVGLAVISLTSGIYSYVFSVSLADVNGARKVLSMDNNKLRVGTFNKWYKSVNFGADLSELASSDVDILVLQEVDPIEVEIAKGVLNLGFSYITDCDCSAGATEVAVLSRYPITNAVKVYQHPDSVIIRTIIDSPRYGEFALYALHMHVPYNQASYNLKEEAFNILRNQATSESLPVFIAGDFNTTIFSPDMIKLNKDQSIFKHVVTRSWPRCSWYGFGPALCARIDYVFVPASAQVYAATTGTETYSDHRSFVVELDSIK